MTPPRPAIFLDRDGVINVDSGFPHRPDQLVLTPTAAIAIRIANDAGYRTIVVTNQSGVARGLFGLDDVARFHAALEAEIAARAGARIDAFYVCPYFRDGIVPAFAIDHPDRKPNPGMVLRAMADFAIDAGGSVMIGDKASDIECGQRAGIAAIRVPRDTCDLAATVTGWIERGSGGAPR